MVKTESKLAKPIFEEGEHKGVIIEEEVRDYKKYKYVDFYIENENKRIRVGYSLNVTHDEKGNPKSELAELLHKFGLDITKNPDTNDLIGQKCKFYVTVKSKGENEYTEVLKQSLKPLK